MTTALYLVMLTLGIHVDFRDIPFVCALLNLGSPSRLRLAMGVFISSSSSTFLPFCVPKHEGFTISIIFHA